MKTTRRLFIALCSAMLVPFRGRAATIKRLVVPKTSPAKLIWVSPARLGDKSVSVYSQRQDTTWPVYEPMPFQTSEELIITGEHRLFTDPAIGEKFYQDEFEAIIQPNPIPFNAEDWWERQWQEHIKHKASLGLPV